MVWVRVRPAVKDDLSVILTLVNGTLGLVYRKTEKSVYYVNVTEIEMKKLLKNGFCEVLLFRIIIDVFILNHHLINLEKLFSQNEKVYEGN